MSAARAERRFAERAGVGIVIDRDRRIDDGMDALDEREIIPSADVRREGNALVGEIDWTAESDSAAIDIPPGPDDLFDLRDHPFGSAVAIGTPRFAADHFVVLKKRRRELSS